MKGPWEQAIQRGVRLYQRLLILYPARHRREYGRWMVQLFRDQSRDCAERSGWLGLVGFGCRVLWDTAKMSVVEHAVAIRARCSTASSRRLNSTENGPFVLIASGL